jgi:hypothetical protein
MIGIRLALEDYPFDEIARFMRDVFRRLYLHAKEAKEKDDNSYKKLFTLLMEVYKQYLGGFIDRQDLIFVLGELYRTVGKDLLET